ncbi:hypothetical protein FSP39_017186 [Pinctada imbricata]|uniref:Uncharacterized protein n=1 Tax=Pinctada imbricata TaxID=66713 RepID=A0AA89BT77_PINIB|nr:hypothetical protein FSP39_017186 [Pinctada imbricata]
MVDTAIAYIELAFTINEKGHMGISRSSFLYENLETNDVCDREINELCIFDKEMGSKDREPEYYIFESDDGEKNDEQSDETCNHEEETDTASTGFDVDADNCAKLLVENAPKEYSNESPLTELTSDFVTVTTPPRKLSSPVSLIIVAIATLPDDKIVMATQTGEIMIFDATFKFLFLREFPYKFEDVSVINTKTLAMTCGFCIHFFSLGRSNIVELSDQTIDLEYSGGTTVHSIEHLQSKLVVVCNIQTVRTIKNEPSVRFFDIRGHHSQTIPIPSLKNPCKMKCSPNGKLIFLCDSLSKTIVCLKNKGTILWTLADDKVPRDIVLARNSIYVLYEDTTEVVGLSMTTGKTKARAEMPSSLKNLPCKLEYQKEKKQLIACSEEIYVGDPNIIFPLKIKKI